MLRRQKALPPLSSGVGLFAKEVEGLQSGIPPDQMLQRHLDADGQLKIEGWNEEEIGGYGKWLWQIDG
jgi:hypothetical protein